MNTVINVHDLKTNYSKYLDQVIAGDEVLLGKHGKAVAKIVPLTLATEPRVPGALKGKIVASVDFDEPLMGLWNMAGNKVA
jgi:prevent-host-death family protein